MTTQADITAKKIFNPISKDTMLTNFKNKEKDPLMEDSYFDVYSEIFSKEILSPENFGEPVSIDLKDVFVTSLPTPKPIKPIEKPIKKKVYISKNPFVSSGYADSPTLRVWYYLDEKDRVQGPFTSIEMDVWFEAGFLFNELLIRFKEQNDFIKLIDLFGKTETQLITIQKSNVEKDFPSPSPQKLIDGTLNSSEKRSSPSKNRVFTFNMAKEEDNPQEENLTSPNANQKFDFMPKASPEKIVSDQKVIKPIISPTKVVEPIIKRNDAPSSNSNTPAKKPRPTFNFKNMEQNQEPEVKEKEKEKEKEKAKTPVIKRNEVPLDSNTPNKNPKQNFSFKADETKQDHAEKSAPIKRNESTSTSTTPLKNQRQNFTFKLEETEKIKEPEVKITPPVENEEDSKQISSENGAKGDQNKKSKKNGKTEPEKKPEKKKKASKEILYIPKNKTKNQKDERKTSCEFENQSASDEITDKSQNKTETAPKLNIESAVPAIERNGDDESPKSSEESLRENSEIYSADSRSTHDSNLIEIEKTDLLSNNLFIVPKRKSSEAIEPPVSKKIEKAKTTEDKGFSIFGPSLPQNITNAFKNINGILDSDEEDFKKSLTSN